MEELEKLIELTITGKSSPEIVYEITDEDLEDIKQILADTIIKKLNRAVFNISFIKAVKKRCNCNDDNKVEDTIINLVKAIEEIMQIVNK